MKVTPTRLPDVLLIEPRLHEDRRGFFVELYNQRRYAEAGIAPEGGFVQDNLSSSRRGVLRGLHYQVRRPQAKLVWAVSGEIFDVAVDVRPASPTFGQWVGVHLDSRSMRQLLIPAGFAHGFCALSETVQVSYKTSDYYDPEGEAGVLWNDPEIGITWPIAQPELSDKDLALPPLARARLPER